MHTVVKFELDNETVAILQECADFVGVTLEEYIVYYLEWKFGKSS